MATWGGLLFLVWLFSSSFEAIGFSKGFLQYENVDNSLGERRRDVDLLAIESGSEPKFLYCRNEGHIPQYIEEYKVNDGVCDYDVCCDGSDERAGLCKNKCEDVSKQFKQYLAYVNGNVTFGLEKKSRLLDQCTQKRRELESRFQTLKDQVKRNHDKFESLNNHWNRKQDHSQIISAQNTKEIQELKDKIIEESTIIALLQDDLSIDYGEKEILRAFKDLSIKKRVQGSNYYVHLLKNIYKDDILIGTYKNSQGRYMIYENGNRCGNGARRLAKIEMVCASENGLVSAKEYQMCKYHLKLATPAACDKRSKSELLENFKVDYSLLS